MIRLHCYGNTTSYSECDYYGGTGGNSHNDGDGDGRAGDGNEVVVAGMMPKSMENDGCGGEGGCGGNDAGEECDRSDCGSNDSGDGGDVGVVLTLAKKMVAMAIILVVVQG